MAPSPSWEKAGVRAFNRCLFFHTLAWSYLWPKIFPIEERASALPGGWKLLITIMLIISPFALVGGFLGGRLPKEGGRKEVILYSALFGAIAALLFGTCGFWYLAW